jgi:hypothetical protein
VLTSDIDQTDAKGAGAGTFLLNPRSDVRYQGLMSDPSEGYSLLAGGVHEWFDLSDRPDRRDHVHSFFPRSALTAAYKRASWP